MATQRQMIGDPLGVALKAIKARAVAAFMAARSPARAGQPLDDTEQDTLMLKIWKAFGATFTPISPDGSVTISTQEDTHGDPQLTLSAHVTDGPVPIAAWQFGRGTTWGLKDVTGNEHHLSVSLGSETYADTVVGGQGFSFAGTSRLWVSSLDSDLQILGDLSLVITGQISQLPATGTFAHLIICGDENETEAQNYVYKLIVDSAGRISYGHEHGAGVNEELYGGVLEAGKMFCLCITRKAGLVTIYLNGEAQAAAALTPPTGGSEAYLWVGHYRLVNDGAPGLDENWRPLNGILETVAIYNEALSTFDVLQRTQYAVDTWGARASAGSASTTASALKTTGADVVVSSAAPPSAGYVLKAVSAVAAAWSALTKSDVGLGNLTNDAQVKRSEMGQASGVPTLGSDSKVPLAQLPTGTSSNAVAVGNDSRFTDARTPTSHASTHAPGGSDALAIDATAGVGSLRTLGSGAQQAAPGNDPRFGAIPVASLTSKGDLPSHDGASLVIVPLGSLTGLVPMVDPSAPCGWTWKALPEGSSSQKGILQLGTAAGQACAADDARLLGARPFMGRLCTCLRNNTTTGYSPDGKTWLAGGAITSGGWYGVAWDVEHQRFVTISNGTGLVGASRYSVDGGVTWKTGGSLSASISSWYKVFYDPYHKKLCAVPQSMSSGAVYSSDGGTTWSASASSFASVGWFAGCFDPDHNRIVLVSNSSTDSMYSTDGGVTWTAGGALPNAMDSVAYDPDHAWLIATPAGGTRVAYSTDGGATWTAAATVAAHYYYGAAYDPLHKRVVICAEDTNTTWYTEDGGLSFSAGGKLGTLTATGIRDIMYVPSTGRLHVSCWMQNLTFYSETGGEKWVSTALATAGPGLAVAYP